MKLFEASKNAGIHIYQDDKTGVIFQESVE